MEIGNEELEEKESFLDIARICINKQNKGQFDEVVSMIYRLKLLTDYYKSIDKQKDNRTKLMLLISQGLKFKNFAHFKKEMGSFQSFEYLKELDSVKEYYLYLEKMVKEEKKPMEKVFLSDVSKVINDNFYALNLLQSFVNKQICEQQSKVNELLLH